MVNYPTMLYHPYLMAAVEPNTFTLEVFEGPLALLLQLLQKNEIEIWDISIHRILNQYSDRLSLCHSMENGAEFIGSAALLLLIKSKRLLPKHECSEEELELLDANFEIIYHLLDYCRFKEAGKMLAAREQQQLAYFPRGACFSPNPKKTSGIEHLTLDEFTRLFQQVLDKAKNKKGVIQEEEWKVSDKIHAIRDRLRIHQCLAFEDLFSQNMPRGELIVTFLAVLEMMKGGEIRAEKEFAHSTIIFVPGTPI